MRCIKRKAFDKNWVNYLRFAGAVLISTMVLASCYLLFPSFPENSQTSDNDVDLVEGAALLSECRFSETEAGVILSHSSGEMLVFDDNQVTFVEDENNYLSFFIEGNFVHKIVTKDYIYIFDNFENNTIDIAVIDTAGNITKIRDIAFIPENIDIRSSLSNRYIDIHNLEPSDAIEAGLLVWDYIKCGSATYAAIHSAGLLSGIAMRACSSALLSTIKTFSENEQLNMALTAGQILINPLDAAELFIVDIALSATETVEEILQDNSAQISLAEASLQNMDGYITITLTWNNSADLDLHVTDPSGEEICFYHTSSESGGYLDVDDTNGYGPEHVFWEESPPSGSYLVVVHHYGGAAPTNYNILIEYNDITSAYSGTINDDEYAVVSTFVY